MELDSFWVYGDSKFQLHQNLKMLIMALNTFW